MIQQRIEEVTRANQEFYAAFETLDIGRMDHIWAKQDYVTCIHPGSDATSRLAGCARLMGVNF